MKKLAFILASCALVAMTVPVAAHHSAAAFDTTKKVSVTGKILKYRYTNPHIYLTLEITKEDGTKQEMEVEAGAASVLNPLGFTKDTLKVGEVVTIAGSPSRRDPDKFMLGRDLTKKADNA
jgi:DNA/RNA endonuclease YhcR with UshA esterase domain